MAPVDEELTLAELAERADVTERTIRYYIQIGLLPAPARAGSRSRYGAGHLVRLRLIRRGQERHQPLSAMRELFARSSEAELAQLAEAPEAPPARSALDYIRGLRSGFTAAPAEPSMLLAPMLAPLLARRSVPAQPPAPDVETRSHWERIRIAPDLELHVRRPLSKLDNRRLEALLQKIREHFPEGET